MIHEDSYTLEWINQISKENKKVDKILVEKVIQAFSLLELLQQSGIDFIFKGGTCLMLLLDEPRRLSIDIDIIVPDKTQDVEAALDKIIATSHFEKKKIIERKKVTDIEKQHFKLYYKPAYKTKVNQENILLDILYESNPYSAVTELEIKSPFIKIVDPPVKVKVPTVNSILGDKLTAYPPNTTGIPYLKNDRGMGLQIIKQLFDIARLLEGTSSLEGVREDFDKIVKSELEYRGRNAMSSEDVLDDIIQTSLCIATRGTGGAGDYQELLNGSRRIVSFIFSDRYNIEKATVDAAKAAYLAALLKTGNLEVQHFQSPDQVKEMQLKGEYPRTVQRFQRTSPEAYYYWCKVSELLD
jgi:predicted nucleotidyltransferase component of viral defense system